MSLPNNPYAIAFRGLQGDLANQKVLMSGCKNASLEKISDVVSNLCELEVISIISPSQHFFHREHDLLFLPPSCLKADYI